VPIPRTPMVDDDGSGTTGTVINAAWKTELYDQIDTVGNWVKINWAANLFTPAGWVVDAGDLYTLQYSVVGRAATILMVFVGTSITTPGVGALFTALPAAITPVVDAVSQIRILNGGNWQIGTCVMQPGIARMNIFKLDSAAFVLDTNATHISGQITYAI